MHTPQYFPLVTITPLGSLKIDGVQDSKPFFDEAYGLYDEAKNGAANAAIRDFQ